MHYKKLNNLFGWGVFSLSLFIYTITLEPSVSFWDCGEFIASLYKLQVPHQPGAPLYLMLGKIFSLLSFGNVEQVAFWSNFLSAFVSAATVLFLFWTITFLARKLLNIAVGQTNIDSKTSILIFGSAAVGSLAYAFSDSFWFSAVETEVYALSSFCTALVFWAILKWETCAEKQDGDKWLLFIAYVIGLSIGIHLLNLLVIPAIALVYYFKKSKQATLGGAFKALLIGCLILGIVQFGIIQFMVKLAGKFELYFVNDIGLEFGSGAVVFGVLLLLVFLVLLFYSIKKRLYYLNLGLICFGLIIFGFSTYSMIFIRAQAGTNINISKPDNAFALSSYLSREQYGSVPLLSGPYFSSEYIDKKLQGKRYVRGEDKYIFSGYNFKEIYKETAFFPRIHSSQSGHVSFYTNWLNLAEGQKPIMRNNVEFFLTFQLNYMYVRYFMWNFVGRQNDDQGYGDAYAGNWISGISGFDNARLRLINKEEQPKHLTDSKAQNTYFFLPLIFGILGILYCINRNKRVLAVLVTLFFFTGIAIVIYLNQTPLQPRERDYSFVGSFYAFSVWIGLGVLALYHYAQKYIPTYRPAILSVIIGLLAVPLLMFAQNFDDHDRSDSTMAKDMAYNYLISCEPNAILFTYGDNDTYPLWYLQEVENVRPDVRLLNLSLVATDWYIDQMKAPMNESPPAPIKMKKDKYREGIRDVLLYDYESRWAEEYKDIEWVYDFVLSDDLSKQLELYQYEDVYDFENYLPTQKWQMKNDPDELLQSGLITEEEKPKVDTLMQWKFPGRLITKGDIALLDLLVHNKWKRPIYFASTIPSDNFLGLNKYLHNEGFVYRLLPFTPDTLGLDEEERVRKNAMYDNLMNKYRFGNMKKAKYLDVESKRMANILGTQFLVLTERLVKDGEKEKARNVAKKYIETIPDLDSQVDYYDIRQTYLLANLYDIEMVEEGNVLFEKLLDKIKTELNFYYRLSQKKGDLIGYRNIQLGVAILTELIAIAEKNGLKQYEASAKIAYNNFQRNFFNFANSHDMIEESPEDSQGDSEDVVQ